MKASSTVVIVVDFIFHYYTIALLSVPSGILESSVFELFLKSAPITWQACSFFYVDLFDLCEICEDLCDVRWPNKFWCLSLHCDSEVQRCNRLIRVTCFVWKISEIGRYCLLERDTRWAFLLASTALSTNCLKETTFKLFSSKIRAACSERELNAIGAALQICMFPPNQNIYN